MYRMETSTQSHSDAGRMWYEIVFLPYCMGLHTAIKFNMLGVIVW